MSPSMSRRSGRADRRMAGLALSLSQPVLAKANCSPSIWASSSQPCSSSWPLPDSCSRPAPEVAWPVRRADGADGSEPDPARVGKVQLLAVDFGITSPALFQQLAAARQLAPAVARGCLAGEAGAVSVGRQG